MLDLVVTTILSRPPLPAATATRPGISCFRKCSMFAGMNAILAGAKNLRSQFVWFWRCADQRQAVEACMARADQRSALRRARLDALLTARALSAHPVGLLIEKLVRDSSSAYASNNESSVGSLAATQSALGSRPRLEWTAPRESPSWSGLTTRLRLSRPSPRRCLAGRVASALPNELEPERFTGCPLNGKTFSCGNLFAC